MFLPTANKRKSTTKQKCLTNAKTIMKIQLIKRFGAPFTTEILFCLPIFLDARFKPPGYSFNNLVQIERCPAIFQRWFFSAGWSGFVTLPSALKYYRGFLLDPSQETFLISWLPCWKIPLLPSLLRWGVIFSFSSEMYSIYVTTFML